MLKWNLSLPRGTHDPLHTYWKVSALVKPQTCLRFYPWHFFSFTLALASLHELYRATHVSWLGYQMYYENIYSSSNVRWWNIHHNLGYHLAVVKWYTMYCMHTIQYIVQQLHNHWNLSIKQRSDICGVNVEWNNGANDNFSHKKVHLLCTGCTISHTIILLHSVVGQSRASKYCMTSCHMYTGSSRASKHGTSGHTCT